MSFYTRFLLLIFEKYTLLNLFFSKYLEQRKEPTRFAWLMLDWCNIWPFVVISWTNTIIIFLFQGLVCKKIQY